MQQQPINTRQDQQPITTTPAPQELSPDQAATVAGGPIIENNGT